MRLVIIKQFPLGNIFVQARARKLHGTIPQSKGALAQGKAQYS